VIKAGDGGYALALGIVQNRADTVALGVELGELGLTFLHLLEVDRHAQSAEAERDSRRG